MEIGARLKEARVAKDISLESLQETTKIQKRYLIAIEEGNFNILPGKFYARAFIKEYATAVGLDPNDLLEEYKEEIPKTEENDSEQYTRIQRSRKENNPAKGSAIFSIIPTIIVVLLVIGIIFAAWLFYQKTLSNGSEEPVEQPDDNEIIYNPDEKDQQSKDSTNNEESATDDTTDDEQSDGTEQGEDDTENPEPKLTVVEEGTGNRPESTLSLENAGEQVKVTFESDGESWLDVTNEDGKSYYSGMVTSENSPLEIDISDEERVRFNVGRAPELDITINGVELEYPVNPEIVSQYIWININQTPEQ
ncbi:helix-turn-helix domain-containing protein [Virgibacillus oceani]|uniref:XRE family transcriptional regulator n=1 Tax=Virgibacillus oceani TaxID=1479511 RepID=A0A917H5E9_9BACI|nr:helix-turn-helix domain-containing protein [Virgibacillus oceani]GGG68564.1 XRE family transcriptional regulator [Virgibacillus oceani]